MELYQVSYGDSLWKISEIRLGNPQRWPEIAKLNGIDHPDLIYIGQELQLPEKNPRFDPFPSQLNRYQDSYLPSSLGQYHTTHTFGRAFTFAVADEFDFSRKKWIRRVAFPIEVTNPKELKRILNPEIYGFSPRDPSSKVSIVGHVAGRTDSKYVSVSNLKEGAPRHGDRVFFIDERKIRSEGIEIVDLKKIIAEMEESISALEAKLQSSIAKNNSAKSIQNLRRALESQKKALLMAIQDGENLISGHIPASAIKGMAAMQLNRILRFVTGLGLIFTFIDFKKATKESIEKSSLVPLKKVSMRTAGGYIGGRAGMLAGARIGAALGTMVTVEFGPGAVIGGAVGGLVFGALGYFGADCVAKYLYEES